MERWIDFLSLVTRSHFACTLAEMYGALYADGVEGGVGPLTFSVLYAFVRPSRILRATFQQVKQLFWVKKYSEPMCLLVFKLSSLLKQQSNFYVTNVFSLSKKNIFIEATIEVVVPYKK